MITRFISFEKPMGPTLTQLTYYLALLGVAWWGLKRLWFWGNYFTSDWDTALWMIIKTPFLMVVAVIVLRVIAELALAVFRMDKSLHDQVTGRAAPPVVKKSDS
ncbi:MAG: DUF4282 domain-containing protein [Pseudomonadota bacterium]